MADYLNRPLGDLLFRSRATLGMTQRQFGEALGASQRTAERWDAGRSVPGIASVRTLARLVFPHDIALATELAAACSETPVSLGLVGPPGRQPPLPSPGAVLVDAVVSAAAEAMKTYPSAARAGVAAALAQAEASGLSLGDLALALRESSSVPR